MIAFIDGKLVHKEATHLIIDVGGMGYHINISLQTYSKIKDEERCKVFTYLHIKEDAHTLYGFSEESEKQLFLSLISISGVGPNTALVILSSLSPDEIFNAIVSENAALIQQVKGIGSKTAQRIILELKDKMRKQGLETSADEQKTNTSHNTIFNEALSALTTLGINKPVAEKSITTILKDTEGNITLEELIKQVLQSS